MMLIASLSWRLPYTSTSTRVQYASHYICATRPMTEAALLYALSGCRGSCRNLNNRRFCFQGGGKPAESNYHYHRPNIANGAYNNTAKVRHESSNNEHNAGPARSIAVPQD